MPRLVRGLVLMLALPPAGAFGMGVQLTSTRLAVSADGKTELYEVVGHGPEGGGTLSYRLCGSAPPREVDFVVSNDLGLGGAAKPQRVSVKQCEQALLQLSQAALERGFTGLEIHPELCRKSPRVRLVTAAGQPQRGSAADILTHRLIP